jgi:hypothetical protein
VDRIDLLRWMHLSGGVWENYFIIQPIEKLLIELIKVHFDLLITTEIMGRRFKGGAMTCQSC